MNTTDFTQWPPATAHQPVWECTFFPLRPVTARWLLSRSFSFPVRNITTICHIPRCLIVTRKVPFSVLMIHSGFSIESNRMPLVPATHAPPFHSSTNHNHNPIRYNIQAICHIVSVCDELRWERDIQKDQCHMVSAHTNAVYQYYVCCL